MQDSDKPSTDSYPTSIAVELGVMYIPQSESESMQARRTLDNVLSKSDEDECGSNVADQGNSDIETPKLTKRKIATHSSVGAS